MKTFDMENPKKVRIQEPEVSSINLIPTNKENKEYETSTHFPSPISNESELDDIDENLEEDLDDDETEPDEDLDNNETDEDLDNNENDLNKYLDENLDDDESDDDDDNDETNTIKSNKIYEDLEDDETGDFDDDNNDDENQQNIDVLNVDSTQTQTQTDQLSFMDEYGNRFASFFGDM